MGLGFRRVYVRGWVFVVRAYGVGFSLCVCMRLGFRCVRAEFRSGVVLVVS